MFKVPVKDITVIAIPMRVYGPLFLFIPWAGFYFAMFMDSYSISWLLMPVIYPILSWESGRLLVLYFRSKMPGLPHEKMRLFLILLTGIPVSAIGAFAGQLCGLSLGHYTHLAIDDYLCIFSLNVFSNAIVVSMYEGQYYLHEWRKLSGEFEKVNKKNSNNRSRFLKEQIKPHFLFNSLNTLSALININPVKAELYVEEMSTVYRYLLSKNEQDLTTLKEELSFLDSYLSMLQLRFGNSLHVRTNTSEQLHDHLLPPFVLQLLIENAVKHNVVSNEDPLCIRIYTDDAGNLQVDNNLQLKARPGPSENTGLANIRSRYALFHMEDGFRVSKEGDLFKVTVPLLEVSHVGH